ncbi:MAG: efflux RND transporter periplasmic adaptor subunit [Steroidobacteraceae bacterium]
MIVLAATGCGGKHEAPPAAAPTVYVVTVQRASVPVTTDLPGRTTAYLVAQVRARVDGIVLRRAFDEGGDVEANQLLYQIDPAPYRAALASAQAQLARARANVESTRVQAERDAVLVAANAVSKQAYLNSVAAQRQAEADVAAGLAAVQTATINLGYTAVIAPVSGRIGSSLVTPGAYVQASAATLLSTIQQIDPIYVDLNQTSVEGLQLRQQVASGRLELNGPGQAKVQLTMEDGSVYPNTGKLEFTDITVDPGTGSVTVRALFPNPQHVLLPGMFVRARIDRGRDDLAILVPEDGVTHDRTGRATVLTVGGDNKVKLLTVDATRTSGDQWVVESGLAEGDKVIVGGLQLVQPGMVVKPVPATPPSSPSASQPVKKPAAK